MNRNQSDAIIQEYLGRVGAELRDLPVSQRQEILDDLRAHIDDALAADPGATPAAVRNLLDRLGDPAELAREARERNGLDAPLPPSATAQPQPPVTYESVKAGPGGLEIVAIILTALMWPIGIVLAWLSPRWLARDKVIATVIPVIGGIVLLATLMPVAAGAGAAVPVAVPASRALQPAFDAPSIARQAPVITSQARRALAAFPRLFVLAMVLFAFASPLISAFYLAIRIQPHRETMRLVSSDRPGGQSAHGIA